MIVVQLLEHAHDVLPCAHRIVVRTVFLDVLHLRVRVLALRVDGLHALLHHALHHLVVLARAPVALAQLRRLLDDAAPLLRVLLRSSPRATP